MRLLLAALILVVVTAASALKVGGVVKYSTATDNIPQQIHTVTVTDDTTRWVSWTTLEPTPESAVEYGTDPQAMNSISLGRSFAFTDANTTQQRTIWIHNVRIANELKPSTLYFYRVGDSSLNVWSSTLNFTTFDADYPLLDILVYGDLGILNDRSFTQLQHEMSRQTRNQLIIHLGDFAYDMHYFNGWWGDVFFNLIQPLASHVPYMG